jgi:hypothetical protein
MFFRKRHISHASRANNNKKDAQKLKIPSEMAKNSMKRHAKSQADAQWELFFGGHVIDNISKRITIQELNQSLR